MLNITRNNTATQILQVAIISIILNVKNSNAKIDNKYLFRQTETSG